MQRTRIATEKRLEERKRKIVDKVIADGAKRVASAAGDGLTDKDVDPEDFVFDFSDGD